MKSILLIGFIFVFLTIASFFGYKLFQPRSIEETIFLDKTDTLQVRPDTTVFSTLDLTNNKWSNIIIHINTISDFEFSPAFTTNLPSQFLLLSNPIQRDSAISTFKLSILSLFDSITHSPIGRKHSSIYGPMIRELNHLEKSKADERKAIVYSDLCQNIASFSTYDEKSLSLIKTNPEKEKELFHKMGMEGNYHGIQVYFIFQPRNYDENRRFLIMSNFFKDILSSAGADVYVGSTLPENS